MTLNTSTEGFLISFKKPDLDKLRVECYSAILGHYAEGHTDIRVQFRICMWKKKYLIISKFVIIGTDRKTNEAIKIYKGTNAIKKYIVAKWKFDHAQAKEIEWNVARFDCDGESVRVSTSMDERVLEAAKRDVDSGLIDRTVSGLGQIVHDLTIGAYRYTNRNV